LPSAEKRRRPPSGRTLGSVAQAARRAVTVGGCTLIAAGALAAGAQAAPGDPLFTFSPKLRPPPPFGPAPPTIPPPTGYLNGPCGLAVDSAGNFYLVDHYHDRVDVYDGAATYGPSAYGDTGYITQLSAPDPDAGPCYLALDSAGDLYVGDYHGAVRKHTPDAYPPTPGANPPDTGTPYTPTALIDSGRATGLAVDAADDIYVAHRDRVSVYDSAGAHQADIGLGSLGEGYGVAVSAAGEVYVADAAEGTVKVYDPADVANFPAEPSAVIDGSTTPAGEFTSLRDTALALDSTSGRLYVLDNTQPAGAEQPRSRVHVFNSAGAYLGHLKYDAVDGAPSIPPAPPGGDSLFPTVPIGGAAPPPGGIACEGDNCQVLPPEPVDPTLTTLLRGIGNPRVRYRRYPRSCGPLAREARKLSRRARRAGNPAKMKKRAERAEHAVKRCRRSNRAAAASVAATSSSVLAPAGEGRAGSGAASVSAPGPVAQGLLPGAAGFDVSAPKDGVAATQAGSHPYSLEFAFGLDQSAGEADLRSLSVEFPPGLLANPATTSMLCSSTAFNTPRSSPYAPSQSGESCPDFSQVGTVEVTSGLGGGQTLRFGLFEFDPPPGAAMRLGASPFGQPLFFDVRIDSDEKGTYLVLGAGEVPGALQLQRLELTLWGTPWDASHNTERGNA
jgi:DNA-binding beta-propeller fold protein YncE